MAEDAFSPGGGVIAKLGEAALTSDGLSLDTGATIPPGYSALWIVAYVRGAGASAQNNVDVQFNGDSTAANYGCQRFLDSNTSTSTNYFSGAVVGQVAGDTAASGVYGMIDIVIPMYSFSSGQKFGRAFSSSVLSAGSNSTTSFYGFTWFNNAAINRVALVNDSVGTNLKANSHMVVYGLP